MINMKLNKYTKITIFCTILLVSFLIPRFALGQGSGITETRVNWDVVDETFNDNWTWEDSSWEFGPQAKFRIEYLNGTEIDGDNEYINIDEEFIIRGTIPDAIFQGRDNRSLGAIDVHWNLQVYDEGENNNPAFMGRPLLEANLNLVYYSVHPSEIWDWYYLPPGQEIIYEEGWEWEVNSWQQNNTMGEGFEGQIASNEADEYKSLPERLKIAAEEPEVAQDYQEPEPFYTINWDECEAIYNELTETWEIQWRGKFNERVYIGTYRVEMGVYSNVGERINMWGFSSWDFESGETPEKYIGVGELAVFNNWWGYGQWGLKTLDSVGRETRTVGTEESLTFRFNISSQIEPGFVYATMNIPNWYKETSDEVGWHEESIAQTGGWVYDGNVGTYVYNPNASFSTRQWVMGSYEYEEWINNDEGGSVLLNVSGWDWSTNNPVWTDWGAQWHQKQLFLIYNQTTGETALKIGYERWIDNPLDPYSGGRQEFVLNDVNTSNVFEDFFRLSSSDNYVDTEGRMIVEFTGYFTDLIGSSENQFWYSAGVIDVYGNQQPSNMAWGEIGINQPQVNSWIVDDSGGKWDKPFFNMKPNEAFLVRNELLGSSEFWNSIDGLSFRINCWDSQWSDDIEFWSNIEIIATYDLNSGVTTFEAYNQTSKRVWENSTYEDWVRVEKVGWHWEYNDALGYDEWVNGTYEDLDWVELTDLHWQDYQFNQETDEWIKGWLPPRGPETEISSEIDFLIINSVLQYTNADGSFIDLSITIQEGAPEASYDWEVEFLKREWGYDYSKPWGQYDSWQWIGKDVYYYEDNGIKNYVPNPEMRNYVTIDNDNYLVKEMPYVVIAGQVRPIKVVTFIDWSNQIQESILFQEWDWQTGQDIYYYIDASTNAKIIFKEGEKAFVYTVTLNDTGTTDTFQTMMNRPSEYWDSTTSEYVYYFVGLNGSLHYVSSYTEWNETGGDIMSDSWNPDNTWEAANTHLRTIDSSIDQIIISAETRTEENRKFFVVLDGITQYEILSQGIQYFNGLKYFIGTNGAKYDIATAAYNEQYGTDMTVNIDGIMYYISDSMEGYKANYGGVDIFIPHHYNGYHQNWNEILGRYYYTNEGGVESILPYSGANVNDRWQMEGTVTGLKRGAGRHYGAVPVVRFIHINGSLYLMSNLTYAPGTQELISGDIVLNGNITALDVLKSLVTTVNGTLNFNLTAIGELVPYGEFYSRFPFEENDTLQVLKDQKIVIHREWLSHFGVDNFYPENGTFFLNLTDDTKINVRVNYSVPIFNVTVKIGNNEIWMEDLLSLSPGEEWNQSIKYLPLLNGTHLELPQQSWIELIEEYSAMLEFNNTIDHGDYNWTEPDLWTENGLGSKTNFTFRTVEYQYDNFTFTDGLNGWDNFLRRNMMRRIEAEIEPGTWKTLKNPDYDWYSKEAMGWNKIFNLTVGANTHLLQREKSFINLYQTIWGHPYGYFFERQEVMSVKTPWNLIFGTPRNNMWGYRMFSTTDEGALDLDGDLSTTDDQYYVFRTYESQDTFSHTRNILELEIDYDPITNVGGNNMWMWSSMGVNTMEWTYEWSEEYTWFKADGTFAKVNSTEMEEITNIVLDENGFERPGYWEIGRMVQNRTWEDVLAEAEKFNWDWVLDNTHEWTWIEFNIDQNYWADFYADGSMEEIKSALVTNRYEYSGLMLYKDNDTDGFMDIGINSEITHFFVPSSVEDVSFYFPDVSNVTSHTETREYWNWDGPYTKEVEVYTFVGAAEVDWGVKFSSINGTTYPFDNDNRRSMWDWYDGVIDGEDFRGFESKPVKVTIDKLDFMVHFNGNTTADGLNFNTEMKVDQWVGDWTPHITGGRDNLENYSLSLTYYVLTGAAGMDYESKGEDSNEGAKILDENNQTLNADNQTISESFSMVLGDADESFAKAELGSPYTWSFDTSEELEVSVFTTPISTFSGAFMSDSDQSCTSFAFDAELYFMSVGFSKWDGYEVYNDPCFTAYVGASSHGSFELGSPLGILAIGGIGGGITIAIAVIIIRKKKKKKF